MIPMLNPLKKILGLTAAMMCLIVSMAWAEEDLTEPLPIEPEPPTTQQPPSDTEPQTPGQPAPKKADELPPAKVKESQLTLDMAALAEYTFYDTLDHYGIKYHLKLTCPKIDMTKRMSDCSGKAEITTQVDGFLAKGGNIECKLQTIPSETPYEINIIRTPDNRCKVKVTLSKTIVEDWQSVCVFLDDPLAKFVTKGEPEKLLQAALDRAEPKLAELGLDDCGSGNASVSLKVPQYKIDEVNLGYWEIEGFGSLAFEPIEEKVKPAP